MKILNQHIFIIPSVQGTEEHTLKFYSESQKGKELIVLQDGIKEEELLSVLAERFKNQKAIYDKINELSEMVKKLREEERKKVTKETTSL